MASIRQFGVDSLPILVAVTLCFFSQSLNTAVHGDDSYLNAEAMQENVIDMGVATGQGGFVVDLVRMDSDHMTKTERIRRAIARSRGRLNMFLSKSPGDLKDIDTPVHAGNGEFLMQIAIGTPLLTYNAIVDTGSDLVWTQCKPCDKCYNQTGEIFDPSKSSTYETVPCSSSLCQALSYSECTRGCQYLYGYGDGSFTSGVLAYETFTLATTSRRNTAIPRVAFGCGHDNEGGGFTPAGGLVGMGRGTLSLISQLGPKGNNKFSYCLVSFDDSATKTSPLLFGNSADLRGPGVKSTPLVQNKAKPTFYYLTLEGVSVGGSRIDFPAGTVDLQADGSGGIIIDSGTTITYLEQTAYDSVKRAVKERVTLEQANGSDLGLDVCYKVSSDMSKVKLPAITFHFAGGADFDLPDENSFIVDDESRVLCLAMAGSSTMSIFGNIQQQNFHILYDLGQNRLSFVRTTCDSL